MGMGGGGGDREMDLRNTQGNLLKSEYLYGKFSSGDFRIFCMDTRKKQ